MELLSKSRWNPPGRWTGSLGNKSKKLAATDPSNIWVSVYAPLLEKNTEAVESNAEMHYKKIQKANVPKAQKDVSLEVYRSFLAQRFPKQPLNMILKLIPIEKTVTGKLLISQGVELGEKRGEKRGEQRGKKLGEDHATAKVLLHLATAKWPLIKPATRKQIQELPAAKSMRLISKLAKLDTLESFCVQLAK